MMQQMNHQMMGYDRAITMFSPDGRLLQVEYAKKTVKQGSTAIGLVCKEGVILVTDKRIVDQFVVPESVEKIFQIDEHIGATAAGIISDARVLVERAQIRAQQYRVTYDAPVDILTIVKDIADLKQMCTQSGGLRPFGVSILLAGVDNGTPKLFETDPTGIFFQYNAVVIGEGETKIQELLHNEYTPNMTLDQGLRFGVKLLADFLGKDLTIDRLDCVYITLTDKLFTRVPSEKLKDILQDARKKTNK
ncbi:archaeal proteasome endopeptidase complex subunit alpha [Candidatus Woesearchaeota archaeon]|nr:archaeal proteasome endopeptidase complex subunit alpha [Candidatus Woesearchaeota archaeon]